MEQGEEERSVAAQTVGECQKGKVEDILLKKYIWRNVN